jgi:V/A-type H+-transporting ATPase subunit G/H
LTITLKYDQYHRVPIKVGEFNLSRTDILTEIKKAEADAKNAVENAEADKKASVANARRDSVGKIQTAESKARETSENAILKEKEKLAAKRESILNVGAAEAKEFEKASAGRMSDVKDFLNKEFERTLNVTS